MHFRLADGSDTEQDDGKTGVRDEQYLHSAHLANLQPSDSTEPPFVLIGVMMLNMYRPT